MLKLYTLLTVAALASSVSIRQPVEEIRDGNGQMLKFIANVDGKSYFEDWSEFRNWTAAGEYCKTFGMKLATITTQTQFDALNEAYSLSWFSGSHWTSGRDAHSLNQFVWNQTENSVSSADDLPFRNFFDIPYFTCLSYHSAPTNGSFLYPEECNHKIGTLCET